MVQWRMVIDATLDVADGGDVAVAAQAAADWFQAIADQSSNLGALFDAGASTSIAPADDTRWSDYTDGVWA